MRTNKRCVQLLQEAKRESRCAIPATQADGKALRKRVEHGELCSPYRGLFMENEYWNTLDPAQRTIHQVRALQLQNPRIIFAGPSAVAVYGYEHPWSIHASGIYRADCSRGNQIPTNHALGRIYMPRISERIINGIRVTTPERTLLDCSLMFPFRKVLPIFDSAMAQDSELSEKIMDLIPRIRRNTDALKKLLAYCNPLSDNGGESFTRATMIEEGFQIPLIQHVIHDPSGGGKWYRVDFIWFLPDGRIIVAEYDGMAKYTDPMMTDRKNIQTIVNEQRDREQSLCSWGVTKIVRLYYEDAVNRTGLVSKLCQAGVPRPFVRMQPSLS